MSQLGQQRQTKPSVGMSARPQKAAVSQWVAHWRFRAHGQPAWLIRRPCAFTNWTGIVALRVAAV